VNAVQLVQAHVSGNHCTTQAAEGKRRPPAAAQIMICPAVQKQMGLTGAHGSEESLWLHPSIHTVLVQLTATPAPPNVDALSGSSSGTTDAAVAAAAKLSPAARLWRQQGVTTGTCGMSTVCCQLQAARHQQQQAVARRHDDSSGSSGRQRRRGGHRRRAEAQAWAAHKEGGGRCCSS
jgi:hypothetical protein